MFHSIVRIIQIVAIIGTVSSSIYYLLCLWSAYAFLRELEAADRSVRPTQFSPPVTILKPLKGTDPEIYECFRSHCLQDYSQYEIIFGVSDASDPAVESVRQLQHEFPQQEIRLVVCPKMLGTNVKVSNLAQMLCTARYEHLVVNDGDIRVEPNYVRSVIAPLASEKVGLVTCLYRGEPTAPLVSRLESLGISTDFCAGVLVARQLERGIRFGLGSTLAFRRADLTRIGGFESFVDYLADDYELGKRISDLGLSVELSHVVVTTHLPAYTLGGFLAHQLRWARGVRDSRAAGYFGLVLTFGLLWSCLAVLASRGTGWAWLLLGSTWGLRFAVAMVVGWNVLRDPRLARNLWLLPVRDLIAVGVWIVSFGDHTVTWRGDEFHLKDGKLRRTGK